MLLIKTRAKGTTAQKKKFSVKDFFSKCGQTAISCGFGHVY